MSKLLHAAIGAAIAALSIGAAGCRSSGATTGTIGARSARRPTFARPLHKRSTTITRSCSWRGWRDGPRKVQCSIFR